MRISRGTSCDRETGTLLPLPAGEGWGEGHLLPLPTGEGGGEGRLGKRETRGLKVGPHRFPRSSPFSDGRQTRLAAAVVNLLVAACLTLAAGCGKKGDPQAPLPRGPRAVSDLSVEQEGGEAVLTFSYPARPRERPREASGSRSRRLCAMRNVFLCCRSRPWRSTRAARRSYTATVWGRCSRTESSPRRWPTPSSPCGETERRARSPTS